MDHARKFKVWWERVVDKRALEASSPDYDEYTHRETRPGMAWCEGEITITRSPVKGKSGGIVLHFFPDGHVEGDMNFQVDGPDPKVALSMRDEQRKLTGRACLKKFPIRSMAARSRPNGTDAGHIAETGAKLP